MYKKQKGFVVLTSKIIGYFFILFLILFLSYGIWVIVGSGLIEQTQWQNATLSWALSLFIPILFGIGVVIYLGLVISSLFPSLLLTSDGIKYASILAKGEIKWAEVESIAHSKSPIFSNVSYLVINRRDSNIIRPKGLRVNYTHGIWFGVFKPILLLSGDTGVLDQISMMLSNNGNEIRPQVGLRAAIRRG
ncbi:MAG: hypothetical protein JW987_12130 [Anaerolineaceae bacterium]|nr:hypothetical protein [Anaerolineaceae bacterium]